MPCSGFWMMNSEGDLYGEKAKVVYRSATRHGSWCQEPSLRTEDPNFFSGYDRGVETDTQCCFERAIDAGFQGVGGLLSEIVALLS